MAREEKHNQNGFKQGRKSTVEEGVGEGGGGWSLISLAQLRETQPEAGRMKVGDRGSV